MVWCNECSTSYQSYFLQSYFLSRQFRASQTNNLFLQLFLGPSSFNALIPTAFSNNTRSFKKIFHCPPHSSALDCQRSSSVSPSQNSSPNKQNNSFTKKDFLFNLLCFFLYTLHQNVWWWQ